MELLGYFYLPHRSLQPGIDYTPAGDGWILKKKFGGEFRKAPIMMDMIQGHAGSVAGREPGFAWGGLGAPYPSHLDRKAPWNKMNPVDNTRIPPVYGSNFLFEDGHVSWYQPEEIKLGGYVGSWEGYYKIPVER